MSILKRITAFLTAAGFAAAFTACGSNTTEALEVNGYQVPAGVYIYFANNAYNTALSQLAQEQPDLDTTDMDAVQTAILDGVDVRTWVEDKATEFCVDFVLTEQKFEELGLTLSEDDKASLDFMLDYYWSNSQEAMERNGISEASFSKILTSNYKSNAIFEYYYGVDGAEGVTEEELYEYYAENNIRCQYVRFNLTDGEGNMLKSDGKAEMMEMVKDFQKRVEDAYDEGGVEAVMTEMNYVQEDYNYYVTSISEEAAGVEEPSTTTPRTSETTTTTASEDAPESGEDDETTEASETEEAADSDEAEETTEEETTTDEAEETTDSDEEETDEDEGETTETAEDETDETDETATETTASDEETTETETETAAAVSYTNESIIEVINSEDYDSEEDIYYTPSEKTYKKLLDIKPEDYGKPYIVEEDEQYYLVVRYDIEERMTEDDLWTESAVENTDYDKYYSAFEDVMEGWRAAASVTRNNAAYRRYNPYKFDFS